MFKGEFQLRLRQLEKSLLQALNDVKGRILDDDSIITHLETLKTEAREVSQPFSLLCRACFYNKR